MIKKFIVLLILAITVVGVRADEGMWMLPLIEKLNIKKMNGMGCTLTAEEIYSAENISLKDAVIHFGGGCTGVVVSEKGMIFTNHHCGYGSIQRLSSVANNYLRDGFTAKELSDEIPSPGLTVRFLVSFTDVTDRVMEELNEQMDIITRNSRRDSIMGVIKSEFSEGNDYIVNVRSFYSDNEFYVTVQEEFRDIRFVHAPPTSIGKFGGDTDNWMWPRHTGDYAVFRVYADANGKPAAYSENNQPYNPKRYAAISLDGVRPNDFAMIIGYPGSTSRYLTSWGIVNRMDAANRARIDVRGYRQDVWTSFMRENEAINIAYASKFARISNYWKNSIGMNEAIVKLQVLDRKRAEEKEFASWVAQKPERKALYGNVLPEMEELYTAIFPVQHATNFLRESLISGVELPRIAREAERLMSTEKSKDSIAVRSERIYRDYFEEVDRATFSVMLETYRKFVAPEYLPALYQVIDKRFRGSYERYVNHIFDKSAFSNRDKFIRLLRAGRINIAKDPALVFFRETDEFLKSLANDEYYSKIERIRNNERLYEAGLKEINIESGTKRYPDANSTMRLSYGTVGAYSPADAVTFDYYTTTLGVLQKEIPGDTEFDVPSVLKKAILEKDFGKWTDKESGDMVVNFISNNDITGGNSGSPVFNGKGELIGLAFDGNWEAMSGDIVFEPELQRSINVDIRYMLFIMEKVGGADRLLKELKVY